MKYTTPISGFMIWSWNQIFRENSADTEEVIAKGADEKEDLKFGQSFTSFVESQVHNWFQKYGSVSEGNTSLKVRFENSYTFGEIESSPLRSLTLTISSLFRNISLQAVYRVFYSSNGIFCPWKTGQQTWNLKATQGLSSEMQKISHRTSRVKRESYWLFTVTTFKVGPKFPLPDWLSYRMDQWLVGNGFQPSELLTTIDTEG